MIPLVDACAVATIPKPLFLWKKADVAMWPGWIFYAKTSTCQENGLKDSLGLGFNLLLSQMFPGTSWQVIQDYTHKQMMLGAGR